VEGLNDLVADVVETQLVGDVANPSVQSLVDAGYGVADITARVVTSRCGTAAVDGCNEALLAKAAEPKLLRVSRLRADTTVVPANVAYPTDSGLLAKAVRRIAVTGRRMAAAPGRPVALTQSAQLRRMSRRGQVPRAKLQVTAPALSPKEHSVAIFGLRRASMHPTAAAASAAASRGRSPRRNARRRLWATGALALVTTLTLLTGTATAGAANRPHLPVGHLRLQPPGIIGGVHVKLQVDLTGLPSTATWNSSITNSYCTVDNGYSDFRTDPGSSPFDSCTWSKSWAEFLVVIRVPDRGLEARQRVRIQQSTVPNPEYISFDGICQGGPLRCSGNSDWTATTGSHEVAITFTFSLPVRHRTSA